LRHLFVAAVESERDLTAMAGNQRSRSVRNHVLSNASSAWRSALNQRPDFLAEVHKLDERNMDVRFRPARPEAFGRASDPPARLPPASFRELEMAMSLRMLFEGQHQIRDGRADSREWTFIRRWKKRRQTER